MGAVNDAAVGLVHRHCYAVVDGAEDAAEVSAAFVTAGLAASERVVVVGLTDQGDGLLTRLREDGADPTRAVRDGRLVVTDQARSVALYERSTEVFVDELGRRATAAVRDGYTGIRFGGLFPGITLSPHEHGLDRVVRKYPATALCLYHRQAPAGVVTAVESVHDDRVRCPILFDDGQLRITAVSEHRLRLAGRLSLGNRNQVLAVLGDAADAGRRTINAAALDTIDPETLHAILGLGVGLTSNPALPRLARSAAPAPLPRIPDAMGRNGFPVPGQTATTLVANLAWRTFGTSRPGRAESVLDWAGLLGRPAAPINQVAHRHGVAPATVTTRVRQVHHRGSQTPLTPLQMRDATRAPQPTEDQRSRHRIAQLLGVTPPQSPTW